jgi:hypothetical protein
MKLRYHWAAALLVLLALTGCEAAPPAENLATPARSVATLIFPSPFPATDIPAATPTAAPTATLAATAPPQPTPTASPAPTPAKISGKGDQVLDLNKWNGAAVAHITYTGSGNFSVWTVDGQGSKTKQLVNTTGSYDGFRPIDFVDGSSTKRLQMKASGGAWTVELIPMIVSLLDQVAVPGTYQGKGDDVVIIHGSADTATFDYAGVGTFSVWGYSRTLDSVVDEPGPYQGQVQLQPETLILEVVAKGPWSVSISAKMPG